MINVGLAQAHPNKYVTGIKNIQDWMCIVHVSLLAVRQYPWATMGELAIQSMIQ